MSASFVEVSAAESGQKLVRFLERRVGDDVPRGAIMRWIRKGQVRVDKGRKKPFDLVLEGQIVRIPPYSSKSHNDISLPALDILYQDDDFLAVYKPAGLPSQGGSGHNDDVVMRLKSMFVDSPYKPAPAHRLDKDTSGVLLAGKSHEGQKRLSEMFAKSLGNKFYLALVHGEWNLNSPILLEDKLEKKEQSGFEKVETGTGKTAKSEIHLLHVEDGKSLLLIEIFTGRTHQIRVQLASRGFPIVGDKKYGVLKDDQQMMLHCFKIITPWFESNSYPDWDIHYDFKKISV